MGFPGADFYQLPKNVNQGAALRWSSLPPIEAGINGIITVFEIAVVRGRLRPYADAPDAPGASSLVLLPLEIHHYGPFGIEQIFFGMWPLPLGYLVYRCKLFLKALGAVLIAGDICSLADVLGPILASGQC